MLKIAVLGIGAMGLPMASCLIKAGFIVTVYNRTPEKCQPLLQLGAKQAFSPKEAAKDQDVIITMLTNATQVIQVIFNSEQGAVHGAKQRALFIDMSTIAPKCAVELGSRLSKLDFAFLEAPVTGGVTGAEEGLLTVLVGGPDENLERAKALFQVLSKKIVHCGDYGAGQTMKAINQIPCIINIIGVCNALRMAEITGVNKQIVINALCDGAGGSWALDKLGRRAVNNDFVSGFKCSLMLKDMIIVRDLIREVGVAMLPGIDLAIELLNNCVEHGEGELATQAILHAIRRVTKIL